MAFLLAFVTGLVLVNVGGGRSRRDSVVESGSRRSQAIPRHVVRASTPVALDGRESRSVQATSRRGDTGSKASSIAGAVAGDVAKATASIALLVAAQCLLLLLLLRDPQAGTIGLDVADSAAGIALLGSDGTRRRAGRGLMARLAAVIAQPLVGCAILRNVTQIATFETPLPGKLERHIFFSSN